MDYKEQLKSPKWQKKRLEIMERDGFQCQCCYDRDEELTVHHKKYIKGRMSWEYDEELITLCTECHENIHKLEKLGSYLFFDFLKISINYTDFYLLSKVISYFISEQGIEIGIKNLIALIKAQTIKEDEI